MKEVEVASLGLDKVSNTPVVILREADGERMLPIWIGPGEASAIAMELAGIKFARPLTHDLLHTVLRGLGGELLRVVISRVVENTYYATLVLSRNGEMISVDARPSDSVALALRASAPIFADESLLAPTAFEIQESDFSEELTFGDTAADPMQEQAVKPEKEKLRDYLKRLDPEDFGRFNP